MGPANTPNLFTSANNSSLVVGGKLFTFSSSSSGLRNFDVDGGGGSSKLSFMLNFYGSLRVVDTISMHL
ncbi:hypothetical protein ACOSQ3_019945 [Xanthoceras sorbifolium]